MENHKQLKFMSASATCHFCPRFTGWIRSPGHFWILYCRDIYFFPREGYYKKKKSKYLVKSMPNLLSSILFFGGRFLENKIYFFSQAIHWNLICSLRGACLLIATCVGSCCYCAESLVLSRKHNDYYLGTLFQSLHSPDYVKPWIYISMLYLYMVYGIYIYIYTSQWPKQVI